MKDQVRQCLVRWNEGDNGILYHSEAYRVIRKCGSFIRPGHYSAKELTVFPRRSVTIRDAAAYGLIVVQGGGHRQNGG